MRSEALLKLDKAALSKPDDGGNTPLHDFMRKENEFQQKQKVKHVKMSNM